MLGSFYSTCIIQTLPSPSLPIICSLYYGRIGIGRIWAPAWPAGCDGVFGCTCCINCASGSKQQHTWQQIPTSLRRISIYWRDIKVRWIDGKLPCLRLPVGMFACKLLPRFHPALQINCFRMPIDPAEYNHIPKSNKFFFIP